ncbi:ABC transporter substrate-binding protein [Natrinema versiforme]|uniref:ABC transporter substrate-binding protein n=1 Tax=Natrinema versiforme TaxID=88724 RepID=A0A4P8WP39_9EURY|nr:ABC transporter substrate-binding protein [Natrinema versiforme]QCS44982.1 ABC transporter substrate-binding protein [Natrinema versiforme]
MKDHNTADGTINHSRRNMLRTTAAVGAAGSLSILGGCSSLVQSGNGGQLQIYGSEGALYIPVYDYGMDNGVWEEHDVNINQNVVGFGQFTRSFTANQTSATSFPTLSSIQNINDSEDLVVIGPHMNIISQTFVREDSDIESVNDIEGRTLGIPPWGSTNTLTNQAMWGSVLDFDMEEDPEEVISTDPPALWNLLVEDEEIDAMVNFTGFGIRGLANPDVRPIFDPVEVWQDETGYAPPVTSMVCEREWVESNPDEARGLVAGWKDAVDLFRDNVEEAINEYGELAGLQDEDEIEVVIDQVEQERVFEQEWSEDYIDSKWQLIEYVHEHGGVESVPDIDEHAYTNEDLEAL